MPVTSKRRAKARSVRKRETAAVTKARREAELAEMRQRKALATYKIAEINRFTRDWRARRRSADAAIVPDAPLTLARVRQLIRDDSYASSLIRAFTRNVVGRGVQITATKKGPDGTPDTAWKQSVAAYWDRVTNDPRSIDRDGVRTLFMILCWATREFIAAGQGFIVTGNRGGTDSTPGAWFQCVESEQLNQTLKEWNGNRVVGGIELDGEGFKVAYHFDSGEQDQLAGTERVLQRIDAARVLHFYDPERAGQTHGFSRLSACGMRLRMLSEFDFATLCAARAEASIGYVTKLAPTNATFGVPSESESSSSSSSEETTVTQQESEINPLMIGRLSPGEDIVPFTPTRPGGTYEPFVIAQLKAIAAAVGLSYEQVARDFTRGTYSAQRQAMLEDRREFRQIQDLLINLVVKPIRKLVIEDGILRGNLKAPGYTNDPDVWLAARYMPDGWQWIDPEKEASGAKVAIESGLSTLELQCGERALDWEEINTQRGIEQNAREAAGLVPDDANDAPPIEPPAPPDPAASTAAMIGAILAAPSVRPVLDALAKALERPRTVEAPAPGTKPDATPRKPQLQLVAEALTMLRGRAA